MGYRTYMLRTVVERGGRVTVHQVKRAATGYQRRNYGYNSMQARRHSSSSASTGDRVMITVAITGDVADKVRVCNVPLSVQEQVESIHECHEAGAHMCHLHVRDQTDSRCSWKPELYEAVLEGVDKHCAGMIMQFSTGNYAPSPAARSACLQLGPDMASLTCGSVNFRFTRPGQDLNAARVFVNPHAEIEHLAQTMQSHSVKPDIAVFDLSMIYSTAQLFERGLIAPPFRFMYVLGGHMALPADKEVLQFLLSETQRVFQGHEFSWAGVGVGWAHSQVCEWSLELGGHMRTGFEDSLMTRRGKYAESNADLVRHVIGLAEKAGRPLATLSDARTTLGLPPQRARMSPPPLRPHSSHYLDSVDEVTYHSSALYMSLAASNRLPQAADSEKVKDNAPVELRQTIDASVVVDKDLPLVFCGQTCGIWDSAEEYEGTGAPNYMSGRQ